MNIKIINNAPNTEVIMNKTDNDITITIKEKEESIKASTLTMRERQILSMRLGVNDGHAKTINEISKELCLTREYISFLENRALKKLHIR